jgi:hypothetical protein
VDDRFDPFPEGRATRHLRTEIKPGANACRGMGKLMTQLGMPTTDGLTDGHRLGSIICEQAETRGTDQNVAFVIGLISSMVRWLCRRLGKEAVTAILDRAINDQRHHH